MTWTGRKGNSGRVNDHPIVFMFLYKLMALNGHEPLNLMDEYDTAERVCKEILDAQ